MMKDKLADVQVEKGKPQVYKANSKVGHDTEEHQLIMLNQKTLKGVSRAVVKNKKNSQKQ